MPVRVLLLVAVGLLVGSTPGCRGLAPPTIFGPGTAGQQRLRSERYDPYPENEPGPAVIGARPRGYERPIPEVDRARWPSPPPMFRAGWLPWNWGETTRR